MAEQKAKKKKILHTEWFTCLPTPERACVAPLAALITWFSIGIAPNKIDQLIEILQSNSFHRSIKQVGNCRII